ncbi:hypothetical protein HanIR_Chr15g0761941 [Helianthus annuus]|nr:hypothetical protein HanIR_Chr15g0761941 [Helianthus annuus]
MQWPENTKNVFFLKRNGKKTPIFLKRNGQKTQKNVFFSKTQYTKNINKGVYYKTHLIKNT